MGGQRTVSAVWMVSAIPVGLCVPRGQALGVEGLGRVLHTGATGRWQTFLAGPPNLSPGSATE